MRGDVSLWRPSAREPLWEAKTHDLVRPLERVYNPAKARREPQTRHNTRSLERVTRSKRLARAVELSEFLASRLARSRKIRGPRRGEVRRRLGTRDAAVMGKGARNAHVKGKTYGGSKARDRTRAEKPKVRAHHRVRSSGPTDGN